MFHLDILYALPPKLTPHSYWVTLMSYCLEVDEDVPKLKVMSLQESLASRITENKFHLVYL